MPLSQMEQKIATIFRSEVDRQEINQRAMAIDLHDSPQNVSHKLNGRRRLGLDGVVNMAEYIQAPELDFEVSAAMFHTPKPLNRKRRDGHPLSKMVGQDKEEMERIEIEKKFEIWDLLSVSAEEITFEEKEEIEQWLMELKDEISSEIAVFIAVCNRYSFNSRKVIELAEKRERND